MRIRNCSLEFLEGFWVFGRNEITVVDPILADFAEVGQNFGYCGLRCVEASGGRR